MPENTTQGLESTQETVITEPAKELTIDEIKAQAKAEATAELEGKYKNEISTRDQKLTKYQKDLKDRMTEEERIKAESQSVLNELLDEFATIASNSIGLDDKHKSLIRGSNKEEIKDSAELIKSFKESITKDYEKQITKLEEEIKILKAGGSAPAGSGQKVVGSLREQLINQYNEAEKRGDGAEMFQIKEKIRSLPKE